MVVGFIDANKNRFGIEPICRVLTEHGCAISPSGYYAHRSRPVSARAVRDALLVIEIVRIYEDPKLGRGVYGVLKMWHQLRCEGEVVPRCQVARLMRTAHLKGIRRGKQFVTTKSDPAATRPPDLVGRDFTAIAPNRLWTVDFTYVAT